jgi:ADP-heptose:LPS heptosyltransferase
MMPTLNFSTSAAEIAEDFWKSHALTDKLVIGLSPSAGNKVKMWGAEKFAALIDMILEKYPDAHIVVTGSRVDRDEVSAMMSQVRSKERVINTVEKFSLDELKAVIARMSMYIAVDSGPIYIAYAFGVPTVDIVGAVDEREQPPMGPSNVIVKSPRRGDPAMRIMHSRQYDRVEVRRQMDEVTIDMVFREVSALLDKTAKTL